jgi:hypothetical protein
VKSKPLLLLTGGPAKSPFVRNMFSTEMVCYALSVFSLIFSKIIICLFLFLGENESHGCSDD